MEPANDLRTILIIEDDEVFIRSLEKMCREALSPLQISRVKGKDVDILLSVAKTLEEARNVLSTEDVYLATVDINLSGSVYSGVAKEGMDLMEEINSFHPLICPIVISSEDPGLHMRNALREQDAIDYIQKTELRSKKMAVENLLMTTFIYAQAIRLFNEGSWTQAEWIWQFITKENPEFVKVNDAKNLGKQIDKKKSKVTQLPGEEWVWQELDMIRRDLAQSDWAIILVEIQRFESFQNRSLKEAGEVLKVVAQELINIKSEVIGNSHPSKYDLLSSFQQPNEQEKKKRAKKVFLGEFDNTGRFVFVAQSLQLANEIKRAIDDRLTPETLKKFHHFKEQDLGYFVVNGQELDLISVFARIRTFDDIMEKDNPQRSLPVDVFEERLFGHTTVETSSTNHESSSKKNKPKRKRWFPFF